MRQLQKQRLELKALFMSGYTDNEIVRHGIASSSVLFTAKPFTADDFAQAMRAALDS